jgi:hypothetical protein
MRLEEKRRHYTEVPSTASKRPEQVVILIGACNDNPSIG